MTHTARAWKDPVYRSALTEAELAAIPANPAGIVELDDRSMATSAGAGTQIAISAGCCPWLTARTCFTCGFGCGNTFSCTFC